MTPADGLPFQAIFERVQRLYGKAKDGEMCLEYFSALQQLPLTIVDAAAHAVIKTSRFFPKPVDWLEAAYKIETPKPGFVANRWVTTADGHRVATVCCLSCNDTGWAHECGCPFEDVYGRCGQHGTGSSASRMPVVACLCRDTNPEWAMKNRTKHQFQEVR